MSQPVMTFETAHILNASHRSVAKALEQNLYHSLLAMIGALHVEPVDDRFYGQALWL